MNRLAKWIMRLYPPAWRARYGEEVDALMEDSGADARVIADLLQGGIRMRISMWSFLKLAPTLTIVGMLAGFGVSFLLTPVYVSRATMQLKPGELIASDTQVNVIPNLYKTLSQMETVVLSFASLDSIIEDPRSQLYSGERKNMPLENVIEKMRRNIRIQLVRLPGDLGRQAMAFDISFAGPDRFKAKETVEALMNRFDEQNQVMQKRRNTSPHEQTSPPFSFRRVGVVLDVLDTASLPRQPVFPNRSAFAVAGFLAGLISATVTTIIRRITRAPAHLPADATRA